MSGIGGKKREPVNFETGPKYVGFFKGRVVSVSPNATDLGKLLGEEIDEDKDKRVKYTGEKDGNDTVKITFYLEVDGKEGLYIPYNIILRNDIRKNKLEDKIQLINSVGETAWVEIDDDGNYDANSTFDSFRHFVKVLNWKLPNGDIVDKYEQGAKANETEILGDKTFRPALYGEEELAEFLKSWLGKLDFKDSGTSILLDTKKLFAGNFKELSGQVNGEFDVPCVYLANVEVDETDPDKQYQKVFKKTLPANFMKFINNGCKMPNTFTQSVWDRFMKEAEADYGVRGAYALEAIREYNPEEDLATSDKTKADAEVTDNNSKY
jgi:hypothetical protein